MAGAMRIRKTQNEKAESVVLLAGLAFTPLVGGAMFNRHTIFSSEF